MSQTTEGADQHIDRLAKKYIGKDKYPWRAEKENRIIMRIEPALVSDRSNGRSQHVVAVPDLNHVW